MTFEQAYPPLLSPKRFRKRLGVLLFNERALKRADIVERIFWERTGFE